ncbi:MAG TPA: hypothetical protein VGX48_08300 [Pyrinomonadaceae bacterium]|jgi:hypothetical protein|nr:hypothetical protein [Pyrinomonadaceae bacterium]
MSKNITHEQCHCGGTCGCGVTQRCISGRFKRVNYFHGMLLTEEDFVDEQTYFREKTALHGRLHGAGVVWGLGLVKDCVEVSVEGSVEQITKVFIGGGLALDCAGNEIVVCEKYLVPLDEKIKELRQLGRLKRLEECEPPTYKGPRLYVGIGFCECKSQPSEQYTSECADDRLRPQYSRVREGFEVHVFTEEELTKWQGAGGGNHYCPACAGLHACREDELLVVLGYVEDYNASDDEAADHNDARLVSTAESIWARWDVQREKALRAVFRQSDWVDVSPVVGREAADVKQWLQHRGLTPGQTIVPGNIADVRAFMVRARDAQHWAEPGSTVDLVTGGPGSNCILFLLVNPPADNV